MKHIANISKWLLTLAFGVAVALFWALPYQSVLSFQEQYQLFLFDSDYFCETVMVPGGFAAYLGEFITQFYFIPVLGACLLAILYVLLQVMVWKLAKLNGANTAYYPLSFIPSLMLWAYMGDENVMVAFVIDLLAAVALMLLYHVVGGNKALPNRKWQKMTFLLVALPVTYLLAGPCVLIVPIYVMLFEALRGRLPYGILGVASMLWILAFILIGARWWPYPQPNLLFGISDYRYPVYAPGDELILLIVTACIPLFMSKLPAMRRTLLVGGCLLAVVFGAAAFLIPRSYDPLKYELIKYDFHVRTKQWSKIVAQAERKQPTSPFAVSCVNLALAMRGELSDRLFDFYQNGAEGLFPSFQRDMTSPLPTCEAFFQLGMINDAERYAFEAQEAIPNHRKSGRLTKRLVECNIINGHYEVAKKYLRMLSKTIFYSKWAKEQMQLIDQDKVESDAVYAKARAFRQKKQDYLFSDTEMDQMLGLLFVQNYDNRMAYEYLICYELLQCDMERFNEYYPLGQYAKFDHIPKAYQQALVMQWTQEHGSFEGMPWSISPATCQLLTQFVGIYMKNPKDHALKTPPLANTFWAYSLVPEEGREKKEKQPMRDIY